MYIGVKLMLIMRKFIRGEKYPTGGLNEDQHRVYLADIFKFLGLHSLELLTFSPREFFSVVSDLYLHSNVVDRIVSQEAYIAKNESRPEEETVGLFLKPFKNLETLISEFE